MNAATSPAVPLHTGGIDMLSGRDFRPENDLLPEPRLAGLDAAEGGGRW